MTKNVDAAARARDMLRKAGTALTPGIAETLDISVAGIGTAGAVWRRGIMIAAADGQPSARKKQTRPAGKEERVLGLFDRSDEFEQTPHLTSGLSEDVRSEIAEGRLPIIRTRDIETGIGEECRYADRAIYEKKIRTPRGSVNRSARSPFGTRSRRTLPASVHDTIMDITFEQMRGFLYITDRHVLFRGETENWERSVAELLSVKPYLNCVKMQFGKDSYKVFVPEGNIAYAALMLVREALSFEQPRTAHL